MSKNVKKIIIMASTAYFLLAIVLPTLLLAQDSQERDITLNQSNDLQNAGIQISRTKTNTTGSPYLNEDFFEGHIMMNKGANSNTLYLRYNIHKNTVEFLRNNEVYATTPDKIFGFKLYGTDTDIIFKNGFNSNFDGITNNTLFRIIHDGKTKFLARYYVTLNKNIATYGTATKEDKYTKFMTYYMVTKDGTFHEIDSPEKDILNLLPSEKRKDIKRYTLSNSLDLSNESDIERLLTYYDKLE